MAIEIHLPHFSGKLTEEILYHELKNLFPIILAYAVSFIFIGQSWYKHLKIFSLLKDYDKGLVMRNLLMLFFIGLFPFGASLVSRSSGLLTPAYFYFCIILLCTASQHLLHYYILVQRPNLRIKTDISEEVTILKRRGFVLGGLFVVTVLIAITNSVIQNPDYKLYSILWFMVLFVAVRIRTRIKKRANSF